MWFDLYIFTDVASSWMKCSTFFFPRTAFKHRR